MGVRDEAREHLQEINAWRARIQGAMEEVRKREGKLRKIAAKVFSEMSEPIDGMTIEPREVILGRRPCTESPISVCVYSDHVMSIPGQKGVKSATGCDACLFCGATNGW